MTEHATCKNCGKTHSQPRFSIKACPDTYNVKIAIGGKEIQGAVVAMTLHMAVNQVPKVVLELNPLVDAEALFNNIDIAVLHTPHPSPEDVN